MSKAINYNERDDIVENISILSYKLIKTVILNALLRNFSITYNNKLKESFKDTEYKKISSETNYSLMVIQDVINKFLVDVRNVSSFYEKNRIKWHNDLKILNRRVRIVLHKIFRISRIFDYRRARSNLKTLQSLLERKSFWPKIGTQIAIVIYITDKNDKSNEISKRILQKNIRALCNCSAYAFHRTRNFLNIG